MYQKIIIIGRLGRDPEMRYTAQGTPVTSFSVATDRVWNDQNGQRQSKTTWFRVSAWRRLAETCNQYYQGQLVMIEGEIQEPRPYQGRDGSGVPLDITANNVKFLSGRGDSTAPAGPRSDQVESGGPVLDEEEILLE